jgi:hypothetical protein
MTASKDMPDIGSIPDVDLISALDELARSDALIWCYWARRIRGRPMTFKADKLLEPAVLADLKARVPYGDYVREVDDRLLRHRPFLAQPLRDQHPHKAYEKARQVGVSELEVSEAIHFLWTHPGTKLITTFPREKQLLDFSTTRIAPVFRESEEIRTLLGIPNQVTSKKVGDSFWLLRSAWESGLGEGIDADVVVLDEVDRMKEGVEVAFRESMKASKFGWLRQISTPSLPGRGIDVPFSASDQQIWHVRCDSGHEQEVSYPDNVIQVKEFPIGTKELPAGAYEYLCRRQDCRKPLNRLHGRWVPRHPDKKNIRGYHISQLIAPWINATRLMQNKIDYPFLSMWVNYCCFPNTYVTTREGAKLIGEVSLGDRVLSHYGTFQEVVELLPRKFTGQRVDVFVGRHKEPNLSVTSGHPLLAVRREKMALSRYAETEWVKADDLRVGDWLAYPRVLSTERDVTVDFMDYLRDEPVSCRDDVIKYQDELIGGDRRNALATPRYWHIDTEAAFFLGLFLAEGCVTTPSTAHNKNERDLVDASKHAFTALGAKPLEVDPNRFPSQKSKRALNVVAQSKALQVVFTGMFGGTGRTKRVPAFILDLPRAQRLAFLAGYYAGDGSLYAGRTLECSTCSPHIAYGLQMVLSSVGAPVMVTPYDTELNGEVFRQHRLRVSGTWREFLVNEMLLYLPERLRARVKPQTQSSSAVHADERNFYFRVSRTTTKAVVDTDVYNFEVENAHSYVTNGLTSHNCLGLPSGGDQILLVDADFARASAGHDFIYRRTSDWSRISVGIDWGHQNWVVVFGENAHDSRKYLLAIAMFEDDPERELASVQKIENFLIPYDPDCIVADAGYGKDRNAYLKRKFSPRDQGKFWACSYNSQPKTSKTMVPAWTTPEIARVTVDRTIFLKSICRAIADREFGLPSLNHDLVRLLVRHFKALAPMKEEDEDTREIYEVIGNSGPDHLAHACGYGNLAMEWLTRNSNWKYDFI